MKEGATLINTSRGAVVTADQLIGVLKRRPDLSAVLDVIYPEPAPMDS
jgi:phosphoglycerate dehydrogenase-like enzyme